VPNPKQYEDQDSFMQVCVPMMMKDKSMENEQAVAACMNMWKNKDKATTNAHTPLFANSFREAERGGRKFLVVPGVPLREQVLNNYLVPADEIARSVISWNGTPITINHPKQNNGSVNVPDPDVAIIGHFYNARWEEGARRMSGEYWIDVDEAMKWTEGETIVKNVRGGKILETSTGYYADDEPTAGEFQGRTYETIHRNLLNDHIAILPKAIGACSVRDGCGVNRNVKLNECDCDCPFKNESLDQRVDNVRRAFLDAFSSVDAYPREVFDEYLIVADPDGMYQVTYAKDTEGNYTFSTQDKWQKVEMQYVAVNAQLPDYQADHLPRAMLEGYAFNKGTRTPEQLAGLRAHMAEAGIDKPVIVMRKEDGQINILDGNHRVALAGEFNIDQIPVKCVGEDLQPIDPEMIYREWQHKQDQGYLNAVLNGAGSTGGQPQPGKSGATGSMSDQLQAAIRAAGKAIADGQGAADALDKAAGLAKSEGHDELHKKLKAKAEEYKRSTPQSGSADRPKPKTNVRTRHPLLAASKKGVTMKLEELKAILKAKGITLNASENGEFEVVEETQTPVSEAGLSAEDITALKALAAKVTPETVQNLESLKDVPAAVRLAQNLQAQETAEVEQLIATIKTNTANPYSDEELKAMPKSVLVKVNAQMNVSFAGLGGAQVFTNTAEAPLGLRPILLAPIEGGQ
jgi:hypothetical protein